MSIHLGSQAPDPDRNNLHGAAHSSNSVFLCGPPPFSIPLTALGFRISRGWLRCPAWLRIPRRGSGNRPRVCGGLESGDPYTPKVLKLILDELNADSAAQPVCALTNGPVLVVCSAQIALPGFHCWAFSLRLIDTNAVCIIRAQIIFGSKLIQVHVSRLSR